MGTKMPPLTLVLLGYPWGGALRLLNSKLSTKDRKKVPNVSMIKSFFWKDFHTIRKLILKLVKAKSKLPLKGSHRHTNWPWHAWAWWHMWALTTYTYTQDVMIQQNLSLSILRIRWEVVLYHVLSMESPLCIIIIWEVLLYCVLSIWRVHYERFYCIMQMYLYQNSREFSVLKDVQPLRVDLQRSGGVLGARVKEVVSGVGVREDSRTAVTGSLQKR